MVCGGWCGQLAGALKGVVYCRGPLDIPTFEGMGEMSSQHVHLALDTSASDATRAIEGKRMGGAVAAYDKIALKEASASFTFRTDDCVGGADGSCRSCG